MKEKHRILAILLSVVMMVSYMPALAFADDETGGDGTPATEEPVTAEPGEGAGDGEQPVDNEEGEGEGEESSEITVYVWDGPDEVWSNQDVKNTLPEEAFKPEGGSIELIVGINIDSDEATLFTEGKEYDFDAGSGTLTFHGAMIAESQADYEGPLDVRARGIDDQGATVWEAVAYLDFRRVLDGLESFEFVAAGGRGSEESPIVLFEGFNGYLETESPEEYFYYYIDDYQNGDALTLNYSEGEPVTYTFNERRGDFYNDEDDCIQGYPRVDSAQDWDNPWTVGNVYEATMSYYGISVPVYFTIVENPVKAVSFGREEGVSFREGIDGVNSDGGDGAFYEYQLKFRKDDVLTISYQEEGEESPSDREYVVADDTDGEVDRFVRLGTDGQLDLEDCIYTRDIDINSDDQGVESEWKYNDGKDHWFTVSYFGIASEQIPVTMQSNPIEGISYVRNGYSAGDTINLMYMVDGYTDVDEFKYCLYNGIGEGDTFTVTCGGKDYTYSYGDGNQFVIESADATGVLPSAIDMDDIKISGDEQAWGLNETHEITLEYSGITCTVTVKTVDNPIKGISFEREGVEPPIELTEEDTYYDEDLEQTMYRFEFVAGDKLTVNTDSGDKVYIFTVGDSEEDRVFVNEDDPEDTLKDWDDVWFYSNQEDEAWVAGAECEITICYNGFTCVVPIKIADGSEPECEHDWGEGEVTTPATCKDTGVRTFTCSKCNDTKTEEIAVTEDHKWDEGKVTTAATCKDKGVKTFTCSVCSKTKTEEIAVTEDHKWDEGKVTTAATCKDKGVKTFTCSVCSKTKTEEIAVTSEHKWDEGKVTTAATCTDKGVKTFTCSVCSKTKTEEIAAAGHKLTAHAAVAATCAKAGNSAYWSCDTCGKFFSDAAGKTAVEKDSWVIAATGKHTFGDWTVTKASTEYEKGEKTRTCSVCGKAETEEIELLPHTHKPTVINAKEATCTEAGYTGDTVCSECGAEISKGTATAALGHTSPVKVGSKAATCQETGLKTHYECSRCHTFMDKKGKLLTAKAANKLVIKKKKHNFKKKIQTAEYLKAPADCTKKATYYYACSMCDTKGTKTYTVGKALGHDFVPGSITKATAKKDGKIASKCSRCGKTNKGVKIPKASKSIVLNKKSITYKGGGAEKDEISVVVKNKNYPLGADEYTVTKSEPTYNFKKKKGSGTITVTFKPECKYYSGSMTLTYKITKVPKVAN